MLNLTYAPTATGSGVVTLDCVFVDNATMPRTPGPCVTINYAGTAANNVLAAASQAGQITAAIGTGKQTVTVNFATDNGDAATNLSLSTDLGNLPSGWSAAVPQLRLRHCEHGQRLPACTDL